MRAAAPVRAPEPRTTTSRSSPRRALRLRAPRLPAVSALAKALVVLLASSAAAAPIASAQEKAPGGGILEALGPAFGARGLSAFARESLATFSTFELPNGIPVVVKRNPANRVLHLSLVLRGGAAAASPSTAGLEAVALRTMARGSARYRYADIQALLDETSSSIRVAADYDYSAYSLTTLDKYLDRLLPVWADSLVRPSFEPEDFEKVRGQADLSLQGVAKDPWQTTGAIANREFFKGHPYANDPDGTLESLPKIDLAAVKDWYGAAFAAERMFVVAVGDIDPASLRAKLASAIGAIPERGYRAPPPPPAFPRAVRAGSGSLASQSFPSSRGMGYVRGDFAAPSPQDEDFMPLSLAMKMLADLLNDVVRDKYGAVYTPGSYVRNSLANYGSIIMYKTKVPGKVKSYIDEAVASMAAGSVASVDPDAYGGEGARMPLAEALPAYKALFANELFRRQQTNSAIAGQIAFSVISTGDYRSYLLDLDRIEAATADQVRSAFERYVLGGDFVWAVVGPPNLLLGVAGVDFETFAKR